MTYFYTYRMYYDCPTCDSFSEEIMLSEAFYSDIELIEDIKKYANNNLFLDIHKIDDEGQIVKMTSVESSYGFHKIGKVWFTLEGHDYHFDWVHEKQRYVITTTNEQYNLIYGKE